MRPHLSSRLAAVPLGLTLGLGLVVAPLVALHAAPGSPHPTTERLRLAAGSGPQSDFQRLNGTDLNKGGLTGTRMAGSTVVLAPDAPTVATPWGSAVGGLWTSPWISARTPFTQLVPSWKVDVPDGSWIQVTVRVKATDGRISSFDNVARWSPRDNTLQRTSFDAQSDDLARMATDTLVSQAGPLSQWQVRLNLYRRTTATGSPAIVQVGAVATTPTTATPTTSTPRYGAKTLVVPTYSQYVHRGEYPQYGGGGEAWCSPTSLAMILGYYHALPDPATYTWVGAGYRDRVVDAVARLTYDYAYQGTGNWPFNTALGASQAGNAFVTRLQDLRQAEKFIQAGIPLAASISFGSGQLGGAPISASAGHLVVISGFTADGDVVVNDPAAPSDTSVRRTYDRGQFERAWAHSQNTVYVVKDAAHPLPETTATNW